MFRAVFLLCEGGTGLEDSRAESSELHTAMASLLRKFRTRSLSKGELAILAFFIAQALDAAFTYWGVALHGRDIEGNPLLASLMFSIGEGPALASAKLAAAGCGMILHLTNVHRIVAVLTAFYVCAALLPWMWVFTSVPH
ncbi:hypothetical protein LuPra_06196 [Luteitalea pratensis]|uniref:DUF5658 domain-containing protein n=2 Tax=Luteitalea pratensis TaxID=1855912 RepID=A0A143PWG2_LUTPR|nr:hypothetical protein LuPra_06196 [Luteitalea pratensis]